MEYTSIYPKLQVTSNSEYAKYTVLFFRIIALIILINIVLSISTLLSIHENHISPMAASVTGVFGIISSVPYLLLIVFFILWMRRAYHNLHQSGIEGLQYTAGWAAAAWFVPFANFVIPFRIVKEIWNETQQTFFKVPIEEIDEDLSVNYWWACYIISGIIGGISYFFIRNGQLEISLFVAILSHVVSLFAAIYGAKMVRDISVFENDMMKRAEAMYESDLAVTAQRYLESTKTPASGATFTNENQIEIDNGDDLAGEYVENAERGKLLYYSLHVMIFFAFAYGAMCMYVFSESNNSNYFEILGASHRMTNNIVLIGLVVFLFIGILAMLWMKRACSNLQTIGMKGLSFQAGMAIYGWLIPIGNFFIPYLILRDIDRCTQEALSDEKMPEEKSKTNSLLILFFWISFLFGLMFLFQSIIQMDVLLDFRKIRNGAMSGIIASILGIIALFLGTIIVKNISKNEAELLVKVELRYGEEKKEENGKGENIPLSGDENSPKAIQ